MVAKCVLFYEHDSQVYVKLKLTRCGDVFFRCWCWISREAAAAACEPETNAG